jgi:hypothetical protein
MSEGEKRVELRSWDEDLALGKRELGLGFGRQIICYYGMDDI